MKQLISLVAAIAWILTVLTWIGFIGMAVVFTLWALDEIIPGNI